MDTYQGGKYSQEIDNAQAKPNQGCSHDEKS